MVKHPGFEVRKIWMHVLALQLTTCVLWDMFMQSFKAGCLYL